MLGSSSKAVEKKEDPVPRMSPVVKGSNDDGLFVMSGERDDENDDESSGGRRYSGFSVKMVPPIGLPSTQQPILGSPGQASLNSGNGE